MSQENNKTVIRKQETTEERLAELVGREVVLCAPHPWADYVGKVVAPLFTPVGWTLEVELSNGHRCGVTKPEQMKFLGDRGLDGD